MRLRTAAAAPGGGIQPAEATSADGLLSAARRRSQKRRPIYDNNPSSPVAEACRSHACLIFGLCFLTGLEVAYFLFSFGGMDHIGDIRSSSLGISFLRRGRTTIGDNKNSLPLDDDIDVDDAPRLDNYYSRPHIRPEPSRSVPLIVGGSDGSGTRAWVEVLQELGVNMVVEDAGTLDVHAAELSGGAGWPGLVSQVLNLTHAAIYDLDSDLPKSLTAVANSELNSLFRDLEMEATAKENILREQAEDAKTPRPTSTISFGFKAPVSMLLLPFFRRNLPVFKFLHIIRDGRDVSLSENHSPVSKFFKVYMGIDRAKQLEHALVAADFGWSAIQQIQAMQLWNEWNRDVLRYEKDHSDGTTFDVLAVRTEDLLERKYETLWNLADFVGSSMSPEQLCCMSQEQLTDIGGRSSNGQNLPHGFNPGEFDLPQDRYNPGFGLHGGGGGVGGGGVGNWEDIRKRMVEQHRDERPTGRRLLEQADLHQLSRFFRQADEVRDANVAAPVSIRERYGKWVQKLVGKPALSERLHLEGAESLRLFGYEPRGHFMDRPRDSLPECKKMEFCQVIEK